MLSVDKEYWGKDVLETIKQLAIEIMNVLEINRTVWYTTRPNAFERIGFVRSKCSKMEFKIDEGGK